MSDVEASTQGMLDTDTVILLPRLRDPQHLPPLLAIPTVSLAELWSWPTNSSSVRGRMRAPSAALLACLPTRRASKQVAVISLAINDARN